MALDFFRGMMGGAVAVGVLMDLLITMLYTLRAVLATDPDDAWVMYPAIGAVAGVAVFRCAHLLHAGFAALSPSFAHTFASASLLAGLVLLQPIDRPAVTTVYCVAIGVSCSTALVDMAYSRATFEFPGWIPWCLAFSLFSLTACDVLCALAVSSAYLPITILHTACIAVVLLSRSIASIGQELDALAALMSPSLFGLLRLVAGYGLTEGMGFVFGVGGLFLMGVGAGLLPHTYPLDSPPTDKV
jgi:hypothetical protein